MQFKAKWGGRRGTWSIQGGMHGSMRSPAALFVWCVYCGLTKPSFLACCCCAHSCVSAAVPALAAAAEPACASAVVYLGPSLRHVMHEMFCVVSNNRNRVFVSLRQGSRLLCPCEWVHACPVCRTHTKPQHSMRLVMWPGQSDSCTGCTVQPVTAAAAASWDASVFRSIRLHKRTPVSAPRPAGAWLPP